MQHQQHTQQRQDEEQGKESLPGAQQGTTTSSSSSSSSTTLPLLVAWNVGPRAPNPLISGPVPPLRVLPCPSDLAADMAADVASDVLGFDSEAAELMLPVHASAVKAKVKEEQGGVGERGRARGEERPRVQGGGESGGGVHDPLPSGVCSAWLQWLTHELMLAHTRTAVDATALSLAWREREASAASSRHDTTATRVPPVPGDGAGAGSGRGAVNKLAGQEDRLGVQQEEQGKGRRSQEGQGQPAEQRGRFQAPHEADLPVPHSPLGCALPWSSSPFLAADAAINAHLALSSGTFSSWHLIPPAFLTQPLLPQAHHPLSFPHSRSNVGGALSLSDASYAMVECGESEDGLCFRARGRGYGGGAGRGRIVEGIAAHHEAVTAAVAAVAADEGRGGGEAGTGGGASEGAEEGAMEGARGGAGGRAGEAGGRARAGEAARSVGSGSAAASAFDSPRVSLWPCLEHAAAQAGRDPFALPAMPLLDSLLPVTHAPGRTGDAFDQTPHGGSDMDDRVQEGGERTVIEEADEEVRMRRVLAVVVAQARARERGDSERQKYGPLVADKGAGIEGRPAHNLGTDALNVQQPTSLMTAASGGSTATSATRGLNGQSRSTGPDEGGGWSAEDGALGSVVLTVVGSNYDDFLMSWACGLRRLRVNNFVVAAIDTDALAFARQQVRMTGTVAFSMHLK